MEKDSYLGWLVTETPTTWWHDSGDLDELDLGLAHFASGVTTNPLLASQALRAKPADWRRLSDPLPPGLAGQERAERLLRLVVNQVAARLAPQHAASEGKQGYVCAQVNPSKAGDREAMQAMARRFHAWAPNIAVKLPVTSAGLDVLEECIAEGITVTATVSFTVPQVVAVAERHRAGAQRARRAGVIPGRCFAVIMIGRLDDYLREVACDNRSGVTEADLRLAGLAVTKRAYEIYQAEGYEAVLLVAALRGTYHMTGLAGGKLIMSIHPRVQAMLLQPGVPRECSIGQPVESAALQRLGSLPEYRRAYEPDGMRPDEFISFGLTQKTLSSFEAGWVVLESLEL